MDVSKLSNASKAVSELMSKKVEQATNLLKIAIGFLQVVSTLSVNLPSVPWPSALMASWDIFSIVNVDFLGALSIDCVATMEFPAVMIMTVSAPAIFLLLVVLVTLYRSATAPPKRKAAVTTQGWKIALLVLFIVYPNVSSTILKMW